MNKPNALPVACALFALLAGARATAADEDPKPISSVPSEAAPTCIRLTKIRSTEVIDRKHILFTLKNGEMYVNKLPNSCAGLRPRGAFLNYQHANEICDLGLITPLIKMGPAPQGSFDPAMGIPGYTSFGRCALGKFEWVAKPDVEMLRAELREADPEPEPDEQPAPVIEPADPE